MSRLRPNRIVAEPATPAACARDYADRDQTQTQADQTEQRGQTRTNGNAAAGQWRGRRK